MPKRPSPSDGRLPIGSVRGKWRVLGRLASALFLAIAIAGTNGCTPRATPGTLVLAEEGAPSDFDPRFALDAYSERINGLLYAGLVSRDAQLRIRPDIARSWRRRDDRTWEFRLRTDARFHDGRPLTAEDVVFTYRSITDPTVRSPKREQFKHLVGLEAVDSHTVRFYLKRPFAPFLQSLTLGIVPHGSGRALSRRPVGAGPYRLIDFEPGARTTLGAWNQYHGTRARIERLVIKAVPNDVTRLLELRKGSVQLLINSIPPDALPSLAGIDRLQVVRQPGLNATYLGFNLQDPVLAHRRVRRAIAYAIDREAIIRHLLGGTATPTETILSPLLAAHASGLAPHRHDQALARRLLDEGGFPDPDDEGPRVRFEIEYKTSTNPLRRRMAEAFAAQLGQVGIGVNVRSYEFATFFEDIRKGNFQLFSLTWVGIVEPDVLYQIFHSASVPPAGANRGRFAAPQVDGWLEQARSETDEDRRNRLYADIQQTLATELPYITLWHQDDIAVYDSRLVNFVLYPGGDYRGLVEAGFSSKR